MVEAQGIILVDKDVLLGPSGLDASMRDALCTLDNLPTAAIVRGISSLDDNTQHKSIKDDFGMSVFLESDYLETRIDSSLTQAFLAARKFLGTTPQNTIAVVSNPLDVRHARNAGLAVLGYAAHYAGNHHDIIDSMSRVRAFKTIFRPQDIRAAIESFRPHPEYQWLPMARNL